MKERWFCLQFREFILIFLFFFSSQIKYIPYEIEQSAQYRTGTISLSAPNRNCSFLNLKSTNLTLYRNLRTTNLVYDDGNRLFKGNHP